MRAYYSDGLYFYEAIEDKPAPGEVFFEKEPSEEELSAAFPNYLKVKAQQQQAEAEALRGAAYREEADPLFFKAQRGEATKEDWLAKVNEIKARYPSL